MAGRVVAFEGNIGVGKSTLCGKLESLFHAECALYKEQGSEAFLRLFYADPAKYGFAYQWGMLKTRRFQLALAERDHTYGRVPPKKLYFWDRSMLGDYVFALWNHLLGGISREEMDVYEDEFGGTLARMRGVPFLRDGVVERYILLDDEPRACKDRVERLRRNASEADIPLSYYEGIDDIHFELFVKRLLIDGGRVGVTVLPWGTYDDAETVWHNVDAGKLPLAKARRAIAGMAQPTHHFAAVNYATERDINNAYAIGRDNLPVFAGAVIYVKEDMCVVAPKTKGVAAEAAAAYGIMFHTNAYKRVVLWHLARGETVIFY